ncbi:hypothetical protein RhiirA5_504895 [Rhizophagus irregularis]|uniref:Uncharacterized protein n=1 Tax=Rhizophagus irregularis TaxID=588596 RepID=A0A2N0P2A9_9GLOM|nr:hypothetical protein RhiirA5_504895 [Rhizophagus irregularis]
MSNIGDLVRNKNCAEDFLKFISYNGYQYLHEVTAELSLFVENGFLKTLFDKSPQAMDKAQLLVETFGKSANPNNFSIQAQWDKFATCAYTLYGDMGVDTELEYLSADDELFTSTSSSNMKTTPNPVLETPPILPDVEMTPIDQTARVTDDKQVKNQSTTANPGAQTSAKKPRKGKNSSVPEATQILTGYKEADDQREQVRDIIVYDIPYTWDVEKILGELMLWFWITDLEGIPVRWFPASWTLRERKQREKFQAVIHDIPEEMTMATLWSDRKPQLFLQICSASAFKIIQTSKGKRKLTAKDDNQLKNLNSQKKAKKSSKSKGRNIVNKEILAEVLDLLRKLN